MEEQNLILQLLQEGKITVDQAEHLLAALRAPESSTSAPEPAPREDVPGVDRPGDVPAAPITGAWTIELARGIDLLHLTLRRTSAAGGHSSSSFNLPLAALSGLTRQALLSEGAPVRFALVRDAGSLAFEGHVSQGRGGGSFTFEASAAFVDGTRSLGYDRLTGEQLFAMAVHDVSRAFVTELHTLGYERLPVDQLLAMRIHGVTPSFIRELQALEYGHLPTHQLVAMRIHGVSTDLMRKLQELGYDRLSVDQLVAMRIHGVTPGFIQEFQALGYERLRIDQLVAMRIHGVSADFTKALQELGYDRVSVDQLIAMRIHGVRIDFIQELRRLGLDRVPVDQLIRMRIHGVPALARR